MGWVLAREDALLPAEYQAIMPAPLRLIGQLARLFARKGGGRPGQRLARALEKLGPAYIKLGQMLATRADIIGREAAADLSGLKDQLSPFSAAAAERALTGEFGAEAAQLFPTLPSPIAAASIAQVHKVAFPDGAVSAVKILRPGIEKRMAADMAAFAFGARWVERLVPFARRLEPVQFVDTVRQALAREMDLRLEAGAASAMAEIFGADGFLAAPRVDWSRSGKRVLTTQWIDGTPLTRPDAVPVALRPKLAADIVRAFLASALDHGFFHGDIHEGNLIIAPDGQLWAVDYGIMGRIGPKERRFLAEILWGFINRDYARIAAVHFEAGYVPDKHAPEDFALALRAVGEPIWGRNADQVSMTKVLVQLFDTTEMFGMHLRPELIMLQKTMVQVEGVARGLDPSFDMWGSAKPIVERWVRRELGPAARGRDVVNSAAEAAKALGSLPQSLARIEGRLEALASNTNAPMRRDWLNTGLLISCALALAALFYWVVIRPQA